MKIRDGMSTSVLSVGPDHTLADAARLMADRNVGAATVLDTDGEGPGIITERDVLRAIAAGQDPTTELVRDHLTANATVGSPHASLEEAARTMDERGFRHLIVCDDVTGDVTGMLSMRDIVRCWLRHGAVAGGS
jgi:CBS domain-containing protein